MKTHNFVLAAMSVCATVVYTPAGEPTAPESISPVSTPPGRKDRKGKGKKKPEEEGP